MCLNLRTDNALFYREESSSAVGHCDTKIIIGRETLEKKGNMMLPDDFPSKVRGHFPQKGSWDVSVPISVSLGRFHCEEGQNRKFR